MSNHPPLHPDWAEERTKTRNKPDWRSKVLSKVASLNGFAEDWATHVGHGLHEIQLQFKYPVRSHFTYEELGLTWAELNIWEPNTKKPGTRVIRFGPDTGVLMTLVKVPDKEGFKYYLLFRRKYQLAGKALFFEYDRGWTPGSTNENRGWKILERDFPGILGSPMVAGIKESKLGAPVWENNAELSNKITHHLIVITLKEGVGIHEFQEMLTEERLKKEFSEVRYETEREFLTITPSILSLEDASRVLNSHLTGEQNMLQFFGENYSIETWARFLALHGWQFPEIMPDHAEAI